MMRGEVPPPEQEPPDVSIDLPVSAHLPPSYVPDLNLRLALSQRLSAARSDEARGSPAAGAGAPRCVDRPAGLSPPSSFVRPRPKPPASTLPAPERRRRPGGSECHRPRDARPLRT